MPTERDVELDPVAAGADRAAKDALRELPDALIVAFDHELRIVLSAGQALQERGAPPAWRKGESLQGALPAAVWELIEPLCASALQGETRSREMWTEGRRHCLTVDIGPLRLPEQGPEDGIAGGVAVILDITSRRRADEILRGSRDHFEQVFERAPVGMGLLDLNGRWVLVNQALCEITGYTSEELVGRNFDELTHREDAANHLAQREQLLAGEIAAFQVEKRYFNAGGDTMSAIFSVSLVREPDGVPLHFIAQLQDISERKEIEEHLRHLADHDPLTGLRNRRLFEHDLKLQVARSQRYGEEAVLIVIDLDDFKQINDQHGHQAGDETLRAVARALTRRLRETDLVARLGGDEFAVLLPHLDAHGAETVADSLTQVIAGCRVDIGYTVLHPSASVGFTLIDRDSISDERAVIDADRAMYARKQARVSGS